MSAHWSTVPEHGSANGGLGNTGRRRAFVGDAAERFEVENVGFEALKSPEEAARKRAQLDASVNGLLAIITPPAGQQQQQQ